MNLIFQYPVLLLATTKLVLAKFESVYNGIAYEGFKTCTANMTRAEYTARGACRGLFACIMDSTSNSDQAILSSGSAVLGFIPTILSLVGSTNEELMRIHTRFPILALLLSITNISTINNRLAHIRPISYTMDQPEIVPLGNNVAVPQHGGFNQPDPTRLQRRRTWSVDTKSQTIAAISIHILAGAGAGTIIWQTVDLGQKAVLTWGCWTDFYPILWPIISLLQHLLAAICMRLCLRRKGAAGTEVRDRGVWVWNLQLLSLENANPRLDIWSRAAVDFLGNANFIYGTVVFSSLSLVSGVNAIKVVCVYGFVATVTRVLTAFVLDYILEGK